MEIQAIFARSADGSTVDAMPSPDGKWSATIHHADGDVHENVPVTFNVDTLDSISISLQAAFDSCP